MLNVDGTLNQKGTIKYYVNLNLNILGQKQTMCYNFKVLHNKPYSHSFKGVLF